MLMSAGDIPVPERGMLKLGSSGSLLVIVTLSVKSPGAVGAKVTANSMQLPCPSVAGNGGTVVRLKGSLGADIASTVRYGIPRLHNVTLVVLISPVSTLPKLISDGLTSRS